MNKNCIRIAALLAVSLSGALHAENAMRLHRNLAVAMEGASGSIPLAASMVSASLSEEIAEKPVMRDAVRTNPVVSVKKPSQSLKLGSVLGGIGALSGMSMGATIGWLLYGSAAAYLGGLFLGGGILLAVGFMIGYGLGE